MDQHSHNENQNQSGNGNAPQQTLQDYLREMLLQPPEQLSQQLPQETLQQFAHLVQQLPEQTRLQLVLQLVLQLLQQLPQEIRPQLLQQLAQRPQPQPQPESQHQLVIQQVDVGHLTFAELGNELKDRGLSYSSTTKADRALRLRNAGVNTVNIQQQIVTQHLDVGDLTLGELIKELKDRGLPFSRGSIAERSQRLRDAGINTVTVQRDLSQNLPRRYRGKQPQSRQKEWEEKRYTCNFCDKRYGRLSHLNQHIKTHGHGPSRIAQEFEQTEVGEELPTRMEAMQEENLMQEEDPFEFQDQDFEMPEGFSFEQLQQFLAEGESPNPSQAPHDPIEMPEGFELLQQFLAGESPNPSQAPASQQASTFSSGEFPNMPFANTYPNPNPDTVPQQETILTMPNQDLFPGIAAQWTPDHDRAIGVASNQQPQQQIRRQTPELNDNFDFGVYGWQRPKEDEQEDVEMQDM